MVSEQMPDESDNYSKPVGLWQGDLSGVAARNELRYYKPKCVTPKKKGIADASSYWYHLQLDCESYR